MREGSSARQASSSNSRVSTARWSTQLPSRTSDARPPPLPLCPPASGAVAGLSASGAAQFAAHKLRPMNVSPVFRHEGGSGSTEGGPRWSACGLACTTDAVCASHRPVARASYRLDRRPFCCLQDLPLPHPYFLRLRVQLHADNAPLASLAQRCCWLLEPAIDATQTCAGAKLMNTVVGHSTIA